MWPLVHLVTRDSMRSDAEVLDIRILCRTRGEETPLAAADLDLKRPRGIEQRVDRQGLGQAGHRDDVGDGEVQT